MRRAIALSGFVALSAMVFGTASASADSTRPDLKNWQHVFVIMMENTGYDTLAGNPNAPWINSALATYGSATNYFGVIHPSQPNYIAITSGQTGNDNDSDETLSVKNLADQLESHGKTWKSYNQSFSLCNGNVFAHSCGNQLYERKHNPFVSYADVASSPTRLANIVDLTQLDADLATNQVPDYSFIDPDQCHDMHGRFSAPPSTDPCRFENVQGLISAGDTFLHDTVTQIMSSPAWNGNSVIFIQWDESDFTNSPDNFGFGDTSGCCTANPGGGHVVSIVISHSNHAAVTSDTAYNHYSVLRTIEEGWQLGCLEATCDPSVPTMAALTGPRG